jgi:hypothetical protein
VEAEGRTSNRATEKLNVVGLFNRETSELRERGDELRGILARSLTALAPRSTVRTVLGNF